MRLFTMNPAFRPSRFRAGSATPADAGSDPVMAPARLPAQKCRSGAPARGSGQVTRNETCISAGCSEQSIV
jgi:hypothetical protein